MAKVDVNSVSVTFPVYDTGTRSLKSTLFRSGATGGAFVRSKGGTRVTAIQALEAIDLHLRDGDRVALIGHNGSGKSTLLRAVAGIYEPAAGSIYTEGVKFPLFNVSLGMDPDSTGYENIILRGLYMGLTRKEIAALVPEIAEFSGLEGYLHLPLRTYSAGMRMRLAFSVITSVRADILLIDEGLGTGDAAFVEQASQRVEAFSAQSPIVMLAAHNPALLRRMCNQAILLSHGRLVAQGGLDETLSEYRALSGAGAVQPRRP